MKFLLAMIIALSLNAETFFHQEDKQKHIAGSMLIAGTASGLARYYGSSKFESVCIGIASSILVGIAKEAIDGNGYGTEDVKDVYADTIGAVVGSNISAQFSWRF